MGKLFRVIALALVISLALVVSGGPVVLAKEGGKLVMGLGEEPDTLDPNTTNRFHSLIALSYIVEPLFDLDKGLEPNPHLVESFEWSKDKLTMNIKLKKGILFHNGAEMTSADVKASYERYFNLSPLANYLPPKKNGITEIQTPDKYTVIFKFKIPKPLALYYMADAHASIMPADWLKSTPKEQVGVKSIIGTGPFKFDKWVRGDHIVLKRNDKYTHGPSYASNKGPAKFDELVMRIIPEDATMVAEIQAGNIDVTFDVPFSSYKTLQKNPEIQTRIAPTYSVQYFVCNMEKPYFTDKRVRMAIAHALNKKVIAKAAWFGIGQPISGLVGPSTVGYWKGMKDVAYEYDLEKAKKLLKEAGWDSNRTLTLITFSNIDQWKKAGEIVQAQLAKIGIKVKLEAAEVGATYDRGESGNYDVAILRNTWWMGVPYLTFLTHSSNIHSSNFGQVKIPVVDTMLKMAGEELDDQLRRDAFILAQATVVESAIWVPLVANANIVAAKKGLGGLDELFGHPWQPPLLRALALHK